MRPEPFKPGFPGSPRAGNMALTPAIASSYIIRKPENLSRSSLCLRETPCTLFAAGLFGYRALGLIKLLTSGSQARSLLVVSTSIIPPALNYGGLLTYYGSAASPVIFATGLLDVKTWWKLGAMAVAFTYA